MVNYVEQSYKILDKEEIDGLKILKKIEARARTCYKSEGYITEDGESAKKLVRKLIENGHFAMIEFGGVIQVKIICNRGLTHELVRHRLCSFAQESTRYCDYSKDKHGNEITVVRPIEFQSFNHQSVWEEAMEIAEEAYFQLREEGVPPQIARGVLPIDIKTEINISANVREWRHIFKLRTSKAAHPQIRRIMRNLLDELKGLIPIIFDDVEYKNEL